MVFSFRSYPTGRTGLRSDALVRKAPRAVNLDNVDDPRDADHLSPAWGREPAELEQPHLVVLLEEDGRRSLCQETIPP
jgi:hypothetical protein